MHLASVQFVNFRCFADCTINFARHSVTLNRSRRFHLTHELYSAGKVDQAVAELKDLCREMRVNGWDGTLETQLARTLADPHVSDAFAPVNDQSIQLYNLHQSKGLEFDLVLHVDSHDWVLPSYPSLKGDEFAMRQDVNLHYVGLTRARKAIYLVHQAWRHNSDGENKGGVRSRFLDEALLGSFAVQCRWPPGPRHFRH